MFLVKLPWNWSLSRVHVVTQLQKIRQGYGAVVTCRSAEHPCIMYNSVIDFFLSIFLFFLCIHLYYFCVCVLLFFLFLRGERRFETRNKKNCGRDWMESFSLESSSCRELRRRCNMGRKSAAAGSGGSGRKFFFWCCLSPVYRVEPWIFWFARVRGVCI